VGDKLGLERRQVFYEGMVQGVGFRYTARSIAARFAVTGYVRNEPDGRVLLVVEGQPAELERFLAAITRQMGHYIDRVRQSVVPAAGEFSQFEIRH